MNTTHTPLPTIAADIELAQLLKDIAALQNAAPNIGGYQCSPAYLMMRILGSVSDLQCRLVDQGLIAEEEKTAYNL